MPKVVFITRGHGFGHAARDIVVIEALRRSTLDVEVVVAAAGTGAEYYRRRGLAFTELDIDDDWDHVPEAGKKILEFLSSVEDIDLVVVDELFWALPICRRVLHVPCVLLTDWFHSELGMDLDHTLNQATAIIVADFAAAHDASAITVPLHFTGPLVKPFGGNRDEARRQLGLAPGSFAGVVTLGGMPDRPDARLIADLMVDAWLANAGESDPLILFADAPTGPADRPDGPNGAARQVRWIGLTSTPELYYRAADIVLAEGMGFTVCELARHGVPTVAVRSPYLGTGYKARLDVLESAGLLATVGPDATPAQVWKLLSEVRNRATAIAAASENLRWADADEVAALCLGYLGAAVTG